MDYKFSPSSNSKTRLVKGLQVVARAKDGTVEALEDASYPWLVARQFHPEMMSETDENAKALFTAFVTAARENITK